MEARNLRALLAIGALALLPVAEPSAADKSLAPGVEILPVDQVRRGMKGHAVTVFKGQGSDRFPIEVVDVVRNYLPKQDAILFESPDPRLQHTGIVGGMSGSPVFIEGKLVGALAYGYRFNKDPLGGITPIENMLDVAKLPYRPDVLPSRPGNARKGPAAWAHTMLGLETEPLPPRRRPSATNEIAGLTPLGVPMAVGGLGHTATQMLVDAFGFVPTRGGGTRSGNQGRKHRWQPGDSVSVVLIDGDNAVAPNGTVTWVGPKQDQLLAFGHPMFGDGPSSLPYATANVHTIVASLDRSVKIASHDTIQGAMIQDRQAGISLRSDVQAPMIPVTTTMVSPEPGLGKRVYENRVAVGIDITPNLVAVLIADAVEEAGRDATEVVVELQHEFRVVTSSGPRTVDIEEQAFFPQGVVPRLLARSRGVMVASALLNNEFEVAKIREIRQLARVEYGTPYESMNQVRLPQGEVRAGEIVRLEAVLRSYKGDERTLTLPIRIPEDAGGEEIRIEVAGGDFAFPYRPIPDSIDDLLDTLEQSYPSRSIVVSIYRQNEGLSTRHGLLRDLPDSVLETLTTAGTTQDAIRLKQMARRVIPTKTIIEGEHKFKLDVLPAKTFSRP